MRHAALLLPATLLCLTAAASSAASDPVNSSRHGSASTSGAKLVQSPLAALTRGPYLQVGTPTGLRVRWRTDVASDSRVAIGPSPASLATTFDDAALTTEHQVLLAGLDPDTRYYYSVGSTTQTLAGGDATTFFVTSPVAGTPKPTRVWVLGDAGRANSAQMSVRDGYQSWTGARHTDLWLMLGDNAYETGTDAEYSAAVFNIYPEMLRKSVLWPTRGNHDHVFAGANNDYYDIFSLPIAGEAGGLATGNEAYYSFDYGNMHFICLDSEGSSRTSNSPMMAWLRSDIAATTREWVIAFWHHPPYSKGSHDSDNAGDSGGRMRDMRQVALPILDSTGVDLVLAGHSHSYERSFLLRRHYGVSTTLADSMKVDAGDGRPNGDGRYEKPTLGTGPFEGAVYVVAGSSGEAGGGTLNHPVMVLSESRIGSLVLDVAGPQLEARFIDNVGVVRDSFTILKGAATAVESGIGSSDLRLAARPNPFASSTRIAYTLPRAGRVRLRVHDLGGRRVATVADRDQPAGTYSATWDGRDHARAAVPAGVYFAVLEFEGGKRATRIIRLK
jgi:hypothetical protein